MSNSCHTKYRWVRFRGDNWNRLLL